MTNRTPIALMAALLVIAVQDPSLSESPPAKPTEIKCPCGDPFDHFALSEWAGTVDCSVNRKNKGVTMLKIRSKHRTFSKALSSNVKGPIGCKYFDQGIAEINKTADFDREAEACTFLILSYAQKLRQEKNVKVYDIGGCNLK